MPEKNNFKPVFIFVYSQNGDVSKQADQSSSISKYLEKYLKIRGERKTTVVKCTELQW